jgi:hypothetical protein
MNSFLYTYRVVRAACGICFLPCALGFITPAAAEVYRWIDSEGKTHYGDRAPQEPRAKAERLRIEEGARGIDPDAERARQQMRAIDEGRQREKAFAEQKAAESQQRQAKLAGGCKALAQDIREEKETAVFFRYDEKGNRVLWTDEERLAYRDELKTLKQTYCADSPDGL